MKLVRCSAGLEACPSLESIPRQASRPALLLHFVRPCPKGCEDGDEKPIVRHGLAR